MSNITTRQNFGIVICGSFLLAVNAGYIGALSLAGLHSVTVAHVTGDIIKSSVLTAHLSDPISGNGEVQDLYRFLKIVRMSLVWTAYIFGGSISAIFVSGTRNFDLKRIYGWMLLLEAFFLWLAYVASVQYSQNTDASSFQWWWSEYFGAIACGMQNALCTSYSGAVIRTTHMTGCCTDIGIVLGHEFRIRFGLRIKQEINSRLGRVAAYRQVMDLAPEEIDATPIPAGREPEPSILWKLKVLLPLLFGYLLGAYAGAMCYLTWGSITLLAPAIFVGTVGFVYGISTHIIKSYYKVRSVIPPLPAIKMIDMSQISHDIQQFAHIGASSRTNGSGSVAPPSTTA